MLKNVLIASFLASIAGMVVCYLVCDLLGNQIVLKGSYAVSEHLWRNPHLLTRNPQSLVKYFAAFLLTNALWAYVFSVRAKSFEGSSVQKGTKFFFIFWLLTVPIHFWSWTLIPYPMKILLFNVFVYYLILFLVIGGIIGKVCCRGNS